MEADKKYTENALKQALRKRQPDNLSLNFNYRMMELVRLEVEEQWKRKERTVLCGTTLGILLLIGMAVYTPIFKLGFNLKECLSGVNWSGTTSPIMVFHSYIAILVLLLPGLDYWLRKRKFHS